MRLFGRRSFAGTSLQMIADELDLTKAAIYYHFRTREDLLHRVDGADPHRDRRGGRERRSVNAAPRARAEVMVDGYADIVARNRSLTAVTVVRPQRPLRASQSAEWSTLIDRQLALLAGARFGWRQVRSDAAAT